MFSLPVTGRRARGEVRLPSRVRCDRRYERSVSHNRGRARLKFAESDTEVCGVRTSCDYWRSVELLLLRVRSRLGRQPRRRIVVPGACKRGGSERSPDQPRQAMGHAIKRARSHDVSRRVRALVHSAGGTVSLRRLRPEERGRSHGHPRRAWVLVQICRPKKHSAYMPLNSDRETYAAPHKDSNTPDHVESWLQVLQTHLR